MARVIKGIKSAEEMPKVLVAEPKQVSGGRLIDRDFYKAGQVVKQIAKDGELERKKRLSEGLKEVALASEEAMATGAAEAFAQAAQAAILVFRNKANRYVDVESDLRVLVQEIVQKILGADSQLNAKECDAMIEKGVNQLRAHRKIKLEFPIGELVKLKTQNSALMARLEKEVDFNLEEVSNVPVGFVRVVTDVGSALCEESVAIQSLSQIG